MRKAWGLATIGLLVLAVPACGGGGGSKAPTTTSTVRATTTTFAALEVTVTPPSGGIGTVFTFKVQGFESGEHLHFEVVFPDGHIYPGQSHPVNGDGTYAAPYTSTKGNPQGTYTVKAIGDQGSTAEGKFVLTSGPAGASPTTTSTAGSTGGTGDTLPGD